MKGNDLPDYLQKSTRRRLISLSAGTLATGLAGCTDTGDEGPDATSTETPNSTSNGGSVSVDSASHTWIDDPFSELNTPEEGSGSGFEITGRATLDPGFFTEVEIPSNVTSRVSVNVSTEGENLDVYLLGGEKFNQYREAKEVDFSDTLAVTNTNSVEETYQSEPEDYNLVFDNSGVYGGQPEGPVQFEFEVTTTPNNPLIESVEPPEIVRSSEQPKIVEMRDNLGHTFTEREEEVGRLRPYPVEDKVTITDDTIIKLRVTKIAAQSEDEITYSHRFLERGHQYDTHGYIPVSSWAWDLQREDYQNSIAFRINIKNDDNIEYNDPEGDHSVDIRYSNLSLDG